MMIEWDPLYGVNLALCVIILLLGVWSYRKKNNETGLYVGVTFGLFGISHLATLLGYKSSLDDLLIGIRILAYLLVVAALYKIAVKK
jgi:uncharacterized membrane protein